MVGFEMLGSPQRGINHPGIRRGETAGDQHWAVPGQSTLNYGLLGAGSDAAAVVVPAENRFG